MSVASVDLNNGFVFTRDNPSGQVTVTITFPATQEVFTHTYSQNEWATLLATVSQYGPTPDSDAITQANNFHGSSIGTAAPLLTDAYDFTLTSDLSTAHLDDNITYTLTFTNPSTQRTIKDFTFLLTSDHGWTLADFTFAPALPNATVVQPGDTCTATFVYTVIASDVSTGFIDTQCSWSGIDSYGNILGGNTAIANVGVS